MTIIGQVRVYIATEYHIPPMCGCVRLHHCRAARLYVFSCHRSFFSTLKNCPKQDICSQINQPVDSWPVQAVSSDRLLMMSSQSWFKLYMNQPIFGYNGFIQAQCSRFSNFNSRPFKSWSKLTCTIPNFVIIGLFRPISTFFKNLIFFPPPLPSCTDLW